MRVAYDNGVTVEVTDDGVGGRAEAGNGITGMRERVAALGGTIEVGPGAPGFRVAATLPVPRVISVVIADDQALVRGGFRALIDAQSDMTVAAEAADGGEAVRLALEHRPDVVLMDIRMPGMDGLTATRTIAEDDRLAGVKIVILTTFDLDEYVFEAIRAGANGFLVKDTEPAELLRAIHAVVDGDALLSPRITRRLIEEFATRAKTPNASPRPRPAHGPRARSNGTRRRRPQQRRNRSPTDDEFGDGQNPREPSDDQARRTRPRPARGVRVRIRARSARLAGLTTPAAVAEMPPAG